MNQLNHKTIFVLDHTQYFGVSSEGVIDIDISKNKTNLPALCKTLWTFSVEASTEYCRIVWDLFPTAKLVTFIVSDTAAHVVNTWASSTQNLNYVINAMSIVGPPQCSLNTNDHSVIHGLRAAIDALGEPSQLQKDCFGENSGRVICITSARDDKSMISLAEIFNTVLTQHNEMAPRNNSLSIDLCHFIIINISPMHVGLLVSNKNPQKLSHQLTTEIYSVYASELSNKLTSLIMSHFDLASTTVIGIPMKEEQNANSSANYDVEIFHSKRSHLALLSSDLLSANLKVDGDYKTVTLKWSTPRGSGSNDFHSCLFQERVTPVDVTSRPSSCLINFLLNGRSVLLEMPKKAGGRQTSHLLTARGGEIFIHSLPLNRSCFEDLPSISEGSGGKVVDYRISDFGKFINLNRLIPLKMSTEQRIDKNLTKTRNKIFSKSVYFPLSLGLTIIYNFQCNMDLFMNLILKEEFTENDLYQCQQLIMSLLTLVNRQEPSFLTSQRIKTSKKEEQIKLLWNELEIIIKNSGNSSMHKTLLASAKDCKLKFSDFANHKTELIQIKNESDLLRNTILSCSSNALPDSPLSPISNIETISKSKRLSPYCSNRSLLGLFLTSHKNRYTERMQFSGRINNNLGHIPTLYSNMNKDANKC